VVSRRGMLLVLAIALIALVLSVVSLVAAFIRTPQNGASADKPSPAMTQPPSIDEPTSSGPTASTVASNPVPKDTGDVNPQPDYTLSYEDKELHIPQNVDVDLDEPRVNVENGGDFRYDYTGLSTNNAAAIARSDATPEDCANAIQTSPLTKPIAPSESTVLCIQTSADDASEQGVSQKLARISIKSVNKEDVVTALVSAWNVPS
jgi:hypothetical protein